MASLEKRPHGFRVVFMFRGDKIARSLQTKDLKQAKATLARIEDTLRRVELGTLLIPDGTDIATFLLSDGNLTTKPRNEKPIALTQIFDEYFANLPAGANEKTTIDGMCLHQRHLERLLGANFHVQKLTVSDLQTFIEKRTKEKGFRGNVTPTTIRKALVTFRTIWRWGMLTDRLTGNFPNRGLRYPKSSEKPPFQTWSEISRQISRGGLTKHEQSELWDCLYLTLADIDELLAFVKKEACQPYIYPMFVFAAHSGARRSEIVRSRLGDLDFEANMVTTRHDWAGAALFASPPPKYLPTARCLGSSAIAQSQPEIGRKLSASAHTLCAGASPLSARPVYPQGQVHSQTLEPSPARVCAKSCSKSIRPCCAFSVPQPGIPRIALVFGQPCQTTPHVSFPD